MSNIGGHISIKHVKRRLCKIARITVDHKARVSTVSSSSTNCLHLAGFNDTSDVCKLLLQFKRRMVRLPCTLNCNTKRTC